MSIPKRNKPVASHIINKNNIITNQTNRDNINNNNNNNSNNSNLNNKENIDCNNNIISIKNKRKLLFEEVGGVAKRQMLSDMLNGYRTDQRGGGGGSGSEHHVQESPVSTLSNMGNTCWLNSVLYTLRFVPTFLHNLHHLIGDIQLVNTRLNQNKIKTSSLGRNIGTITGTSSSRSTSSKDLLSLTTTTATTTNDNMMVKSKYQIVTEKLHELYLIMHQIEMKDSNEPYQPDALLQAIRDANSIFDGNHQQDAHELLVYLLDNLHETCDLLQQQVQHNPDLLNDNNETNITTTINSKLWNVSRSRKKVQKKKDKHIKDVINEEQQQNNGVTNITDTDDTCSVDSSNSENQQRNKRIVYNFIVEDFQGITLRRTKCLECESITERKEPFYDIPVPIPIDENDTNSDLINNTSEIFRKACVLSEKLCDTNKYLCEQCSHYNEAIRDVLFERLPNIMVLQLKRFTTTTTGIQKVNTYLPTPLELECFCETCCKSTINNQLPSHHYQLYCVIMHLGGTMASGHYISYIKASDHLNDYMDCSRNIPKSLSLSSSSSEKSLNFLKYFKPKQFNTLIDASKNLASSSSSSSSKTISNGVRMCKSVDCCGIKLNRNIIENTINSFNRSTTTQTTTRNDIWLECDDENIRPITTREFQEELSYKPNSTSTPYLLFYSKITETTID